MHDTALKLLTVAPQRFWKQILEHFKSMPQMLPSFLANEKFDFFMQIKKSSVKIMHIRKKSSIK